MLLRRGAYSPSNHNESCPCPSKVLVRPGPELSAGSGTAGLSPDTAATLSSKGDVASPSPPTLGFLPYLPSLLLATAEPTKPTTLPTGPLFAVEAVVPSESHHPTNPVQASPSATQTALTTSLKSSASRTAHQVPRRGARVFARWRWGREVNSEAL